MSELTQGEKNKLIERTCKFHAYQKVVLWGEGLTQADILWYAKEKMEGHRAFVEQHSHSYDYATSEFIEKDKPTA